MGVSADISFDSDLDVGSVGSVGPVTVRTPAGSPFEAKVSASVADIPDTYHINLDTINLPKLQIGLDPMTINPVSLNLALKEIPSVRTHLPADFVLGFSLLGFELLCVQLCGEAQIITEPYRPNPCERCGPELNAEPVDSSFSSPIAKHG